MLDLRPVDLWLLAKRGRGRCKERVARSCAGKREVRPPEVLDRVAIEIVHGAPAVVAYGSEGFGRMDSVSEVLFEYERDVGAKVARKAACRFWEPYSMSLFADDR